LDSPWVSAPDGSIWLAPNASVATQNRTLRAPHSANCHNAASLRKRKLTPWAAYRRVSLLRFDAPLNRNQNRNFGGFERGSG
jgi:hypothetical protein